MVNGSMVESWRGGGMLSSWFGCSFVYPTVWCDGKARTGLGRVSTEALFGFSARGVKAP